MATFKSFADFGKAIDRMSAQLERDAKTKIVRQIAEKAQAIADASASADLGGDPKFSGWKPELSTQIKSTSKGAVLLPTKSSAGPWTVAEFGRHRGPGGGFAGPGVNRRTGNTARTKSGALRKVSATKGKRWNGYTNPKHTASKAVAKMAVELPKIAEKGVRDVMVRHFDVT